MDFKDITVGIVAFNSEKVIFECIKSIKKIKNIIIFDNSNDRELEKKFSSNYPNIKFVKDRPGHDIRYALDSSKIKKEMKWKSKIKIEKGLEDTFKWYLNNKKYFKTIKRKHITSRLGNG